MHCFSFLHRFFFAPISATGFGLMRILWASTAAWWYWMQVYDIEFFYSVHDGLSPLALGNAMFREQARFTLLEVFTDPSHIALLYGLLLLSLLCSALGVLPRLSTIVAFVLMCSFHERSLHILGGGDTVLRHVGFLLCISPCLDACSLKRLWAQWKHFRSTKKFLPPLRMSI